MHSFVKRSLLRIAEFYEKNKALIDNARIYTFDCAEDQPTHRKYSKAEIIDMIGFIEGIKKRSVQKTASDKNRF